MKKYLFGGLFCGLLAVSFFAVCCGDFSQRESGESTSTEKRQGPVQLRIGTFNVRMLFDTVCDSGSCNGSNFESTPSAAAYNNRLDQVASGIRDLHADIVLLEEIENENVLADLYRRLGALYDGYEIAESGYAASLDTAVLYNGKLLSKLVHDKLLVDNGKDKYFARRFLELQLAYTAGAQADEQVEVIVFAAHFISQRDGDNDARRLAEAESARQFLEERAGDYTGSLIVMGGDLNDTTGSPAINMLEESPVLLRVASDLPQSEQYTYFYNHKNYTLDHLFMVQNDGGRYLEKSAQVHSSGKTGYAGSDHRALTADFELPGAE